MTINKDKVSEIKRLRAKKYTLKEIADETQSSVSTVRRHLKESQNENQETKNEDKKFQNTVAIQFKVIEMTHHIQSILDKLGHYGLVYDATVLREQCRHALHLFKLRNPDAGIEAYELLTENVARFEGDILVKGTLLREINEKITEKEAELKQKTRQVLGLSRQERNLKESIRVKMEYGATLDSIVSTLECKLKVGLEMLDRVEGTPRLEVDYKTLMEEIRILFQ